MGLSTIPVDTAMPRAKLRIQRRDLLDEKLDSDPRTVATLEVGKADWDASTAEQQAEDTNHTPFRIDLAAPEIKKLNDPPTCSLKCVSGPPHAASEASKAPYYSCHGSSPRANRPA